VRKNHDMNRVQERKLQTLMGAVTRTNRFYQSKFEQAGLTLDHPPASVDLERLPFTTKQELTEDHHRHPPYGTNLTFPLSAYTRIHQTSGTMGFPLKWLDTPESWAWWLDCWRQVYIAAGVGPGDRIFFPFSFGPFIGFWAAFEAGCGIGAMCLAGGGLSTSQRIDMIRENRSTVVVCTPTYALRLADAASESGIDLAASDVRVTIHAGEPGASVPSVKNRIEAGWGARCVDHAGATELGAWGYSCGGEYNMHIIEDEFIAEVVEPDTGGTAPLIDSAQRGELVMTNLGRTGSPLIRYRTGDLVDLVHGKCQCGRAERFIRGGVLGRADGMLVVRGVNVFPSAIENIIREFSAIDEFEVEVTSEREMQELVIRVEVKDGGGEQTCNALASQVQRRLALRPRIERVAGGSLPRYEMKSRRFKVSGRPR
jgi:phenylacetate-CoA ligase